MFVPHLTGGWDVHGFELDGQVLLPPDSDDVLKNWCGTYEMVGKKQSSNAVVNNSTFPPMRH